MGRPAQKRRKLNQSATEEVVFDPAARHEFLTGFHKRKVQRAKAAQETAAQRARAEKIEDRKKLREERKAEIERHVREVNAMLPSAHLASDSDSGAEVEAEIEAEGENWNGIEDTAPGWVDHEAEYIDEEKYTTVTVEEVGISRDGISKLREHDGWEEDEDEDAASVKLVNLDKPKKSPSKLLKNSGNTKMKKKKKSFRYESPAERKLNRLKEKAKKSKQARIRRGA